MVKHVHLVSLDLAFLLEASKGVSSPIEVAAMVGLGS
jgi:hypothetical protein